MYSTHPVINFEEKKKPLGQLYFKYLREEIGASPSVQNYIKILFSEC